MKTACLILANHKTEEMYNRNYYKISKMINESSYDIDLYVYYNDENKIYEINNNKIYFSYKYLKDKFNYNYLFGENYIGLTIFTLFDLYMNHKNDYDNYIFYEDDVEYTSEKNLFNLIFDNFEQNSYDIIFQSERKINNDWFWHDNLTNCKFTPYCGLLNLYVIKSNLINDLINFFKSGNYGHHEYIVNGFVFENNYKIKYLTEIFTIYDSTEKIYKLNKVYDIIHPIKSVKELDYIFLPYKTCIMSMIKNERRYLEEWIIYHLKLGFDSIYLFEDYDSESHEDIVNKYDNVILTKIEDIYIKDYKTCKTQMNLMKYFLNKLIDEKKYDYCLFTDIDEFLILENTNLQELCFNYREYTGLLLSWKMFNSNNYISSPSGNVMDNYKNTIDVIVIDGDNGLTQWNKKSFVNINKAKRFLNNHIIEDGVDIEKSKDINNHLIYKTAWINHYFSKSWEDFCYRMKIRGNMGNNNRTYDDFFKVNPQLLYLKKELISKERFNYTNNVHYISKDYKLISGGNIKIIQSLNNY